MHELINNVYDNQLHENINKLINNVYDNQLRKNIDELFNECLQYLIDFTENNSEHAVWQKTLMENMKNLHNKHDEYKKLCINTNTSEFGSEENLDLSNDVNAFRKNMLVAEILKELDTICSEQTIYNTTDPILKLFILKMEFESCYLKCEITLPDIKSKSYNDVRVKIAELNHKYDMLHAKLLKKYAIPDFNGKMNGFHIDTSNVSLFRSLIHIMAIKKRLDQWDEGSELETPSIDHI